jgi:hypothetical protein
MLSFEEVIDYIAGYDPSFRGSIEGASEEEIAELEALTGSELPEVYREFLGVMGRNTGWIDIQRLDFRVETVLDYYRREDALPVGEFLRIGSDTKDPSFNPHLQLSLVEPELKVVAFPGCTPATFATITARYLSYLAGSMQEMFSRPAFRIFEIFGPGRQPVTLVVRERIRGHVLQVDAMLREQYGLEPALWSTSLARGYTSPGMAVETEQLSGPLAITLRVDDLEEQHRIVRSLAAQLDAEISPPAAP